MKNKCEKTNLYKKEQCIKEEKKTMEKKRIKLLFGIYNKYEDLT